MKIIVVATPKAGNNWLKLLLAEIYDLALVKPEELESAERAVALEHWMPSRDRLQWLEAHGITPVTIVRHPADILVSLYHYVWMKTDVLPSERSILADRGRIGAGTLEWAERGLYPLLMCSDRCRPLGSSRRSSSPWRTACSSGRSSSVSSLLSARGLALGAAPSRRSGRERTSFGEEEAGIETS